MTTDASIPELANRQAKQGTVVGNSNEHLLIQFPVERCSACTCGARLFSSEAKPATVVSLNRDAFPKSLREDSAQLDAGASIALQLPAERLVKASAVLFGLPLLLALFGALLVAQPQFSALGALAGFALGACASYRLRGQLQTGIYEGLAVRRLDC